MWCEYLQAERLWVTQFSKELQKFREKRIKLHIHMWND